MKQPTQPLIDVNGILRFKSNPIVSYLLDNGGIDLNDLAIIGFSCDDRQHFAQLIGYSLAGYGSLSYVSDLDYETVYKIHTENKSDTEARIEILQNTIDNLKRSLKEPVAELYGIHPDDLMED